MKLRTIADIEAILRPYTERVKTTKFTLDTTRALTKLVGNPQERLRVVHIAGTSGKTTTSYYIAGLLTTAGQKTGLTVSPHIASITERVQIDGAPMSDEKFIGYFNEFYPLVTSSDLEPSYFEFMMVFAFWVFDRESVDYAVIETGLGGLYDTSNICRRADKVCVITDIGYDHMNVLGSTIEEIAAQKAGIIAEQNIVVMYEQASEIMAVVKKVTEHYHASLVTIAPEQTNSYFVRNFTLAMNVYECVARRDNLPTLDVDTRQWVLSEIHVPGRLEKIRVGATLFILDGAHNEQKMSALFSALDDLYPDKKWPIVLALKADKTIKSMIGVISDHASEIVTSEFRRTQDLPTQATPASELAALFTELSIPVHSKIPLDEVLQDFLDRQAPDVLVIGSFFAVAESRAWLLGTKHGKLVI